MAVIKVTIPTALRQYAGGSAETEIEAKTSGEALDSLTAKHAELRKHLYNEQNTLRNFVNVYVNDQDIRHLDGLGTSLKDGDTIMIVPSIAGGLSCFEAGHVPGKSG
jgi:adenylyltransferase/sulfurtransferase